MVDACEVFLKAREVCFVDVLLGGGQDELVHFCSDLKEVLILFEPYKNDLYQTHSKASQNLCCASGKQERPRNRYGKRPNATRARGGSYRGFLTFMVTVSRPPEGYMVTGEASYHYASTVRSLTAGEGGLNQPI